jgi:uncharacterized membrane protein
MSDTSPTPPSQPAPGPQATADLRPLVIACYFLFLIACINGLTAIIAVVIAHARRRDSAGTIWQSHFDNLILVFWVIVAAILIAMLSWPLGIWAAVSTAFVGHSSGILIWPSYLFVFPIVFALVIFPVLVLWYFYRTLRGLIRATESRPYRE